MPFGIRYLGLLAGLVVLHDDAALRLVVLAELHPTVGLGDDRMVLRPARLEQLGDARQTAGDVAGLAALARDARQHVARRDDRAVVDRQDRVRRQEVPRVRAVRQPHDFATLVLELQTRPQIHALGGLLVVHDHLRGEAGDLVHALDQRHAFQQVDILDLAGALGDDRQGVRVPLRKLLRAADLLALVHQQPCAVGHAEAGALALPLSSLSTSSQLRDMTTGVPWLFITTLRFLTATVPSWLASTLDCSAPRCAAPPIWKVRMVSWVPGSPIDCAAMTPTASPIFTGVPRARSRP